MFLVSSCRCLRSMHWSQVLSWEWRCSWSSADRRCSNYIWVINNFIAYEGATYIRGFTVWYPFVTSWSCLGSWCHSWCRQLLRQVQYTGWEWHFYTNFPPKFGSYNDIFLIILYITNVAQWIKNECPCIVEIKDKVLTLSALFCNRYRMK